MTTIPGRWLLKRRVTISESTVPSLFLYPGLLLILTFALLPSIYTIGLGFTNHNIIRPGETRWVGFENYISLFRDSLFWNNVSVTARYISVAVSVEVVLGFAIALLLHADIRFKAFWRTTLLIPVLLAPYVVGSMWKFMLNAQFGVIPFLMGWLSPDSRYLAGSESALWWVVVADIWQWTPFVTLICVAGLASLPQEPFEAAAVDGASSLQVLQYVTIPLMMPFLTIALVLRFLGAYKMFDALFIMTRGGPGSSTQVLTMRLHESFTSFRLGEAASLTVILLIIATLITKLVVQRLLESRLYNDADPS